ncbi:AraC family transcriptional regulator [Ideonella sp.]|uniref:AraC family transcriptional regulator n=1 Tax=Ideonella sp. TaxID=1929293 RepID=UPI0039C8B9A0
MSSRHLPRQRQPEFERDFTRSPALGYEAPEDVGLIRCLAHGFPTPLARWHHHDEYELHLIVATSGKAFVGDWIGPFEPGHLVLAGPRLPHNWVSTDVPEGGVALRDLVIQFPHGPIASAAEHLPELGEVLPMLERARHGIEFFGLGDVAQRQWHAMKGNRGLKRFAAFVTLLAEMARCTDYRMLSSVQMQSADDDQQLDQINAVVQRIMADVAQPLAASEIAASLDMSESRFSRFFRRATGNTFTDFVNRVRVQRACQLLMDSDRLVTHICYEVGFNNVANFNRRFLEIKGMTPTEFRKQSDRRFGGNC